jgi:hypothetical protein
MTVYIVVDDADGTVHYGDGAWGRNVLSAKQHPTRLAAIWELDEVDCAELLRDRIRVARLCTVCGGVDKCVPTIGGR